MLLKEHWAGDAMKAKEELERENRKLRGEVTEYFDRYHHYKSECDKLSQILKDSRGQADDMEAENQCLQHRITQLEAEQQDYCNRKKPKLAGAAIPSGPHSTTHQNDQRPKRPHPPSDNQPVETWVEHMVTNSTLSGVLEDPAQGISVRCIWEQKLIRLLAPAEIRCVGQVQTDFRNFWFNLHKLVAALGLYGEIVTTANIMYEGDNTEMGLAPMVEWLAGMGVTAKEVEDAALYTQVWIRDCTNKLWEGNSTSRIIEVAKWATQWVHRNGPAQVLDPEWKNPTNAPEWVKRVSSDTTRVLNDSIAGIQMVPPIYALLMTNTPSLATILETYIVTHAPTIRTKMDIDHNSTTAPTTNAQ
ncbi:hypothetical protein BKA70DRAFT_1220354 [Coprinopsis sp. MPI-PUGE-AT-0042]|nr:hypothetical protein BKA70DRAFT_1220354 [Coprinopsis sp. MPI-PUGE-AT-0042]